MIKSTLLGSVKVCIIGPLPVLMGLITEFLPKHVKLKLAAKRCILKTAHMGRFLYPSHPQSQLPCQGAAQVVADDG